MPLWRTLLMTWYEIESAPSNKVVWTKIDDGEERNRVRLIRKGRLWYFADESMYVYYTPTHWSPL